MNWLSGLWASICLWFACYWSNKHSDTAVYEQYYGYGIVRCTNCHKGIKTVQVRND